MDAFDELTRNNEDLLQKNHELTRENYKLNFMLTHDGMTPEKIEDRKRSSIRITALMKLHDDSFRFWDFSRDGDLGSIHDLISKHKKRDLRTLFMVGANIHSGGVDALMVAVSGGHIDVAKTILKHHPSMMLRGDFAGRNVLHRAAKAGQADIIMEILRFVHERISVDALLSQDDSGFTPVLWAVYEGHHDALKVMLTEMKRQDFGLESIVEIQDANGNSAFHFASSHSRTDMMLLILDHTEDRSWITEQLDLRNNDGRTPRDFASTDEIRALFASY